MSSREVWRCPWPGPQPYDESQAAYFCGRDIDSTTIAERAKLQKLTVLTAASGAGKTSVLRAGVIPTLHKMRSDAQKWMGPVLLLRDWGGITGDHPSDLLVTAIINDIAAQMSLPDISADYRDDLTRMAAVAVESQGSTDESLVNRVRRACTYVFQIAKALGDKYLFIIIDQAEELMGSGLLQPDRTVEKEALQLFGHIVKYVNDIRIVLSLREEYIGRIRPLEDIVPSMAVRQYRIEMLTPEEALCAFNKSVENTDINISESAIDYVLKCAGPSTAPYNDSNSYGSADSSASAVNLIAAQAILVELYHYAIRNEGSRSITNETIASYKQTNHIADDQGMATHAIQSWALSGLSHLPPLLETSEEDVLLGKRIFARMAGWLTTWGGYKRPMDEVELVLKALEEDFKVFSSDYCWGGPIETKLRAVLTVSAPEHPHPGAIPAGDSFTDLFPVAESATTGDSLSSYAKIRGWTCGSTAGHLSDYAFHVLRVMREHNVLKIGRGMAGSSQTSTGRSYELIHDGLGGPLSSWAEQEKMSFNDAVSSLTAIRGASFQWDKVPQDKMILGATWLGCQIRKGATFDGTVFDCCDFRGTVFLGCTFKGCRFSKTDLSGCVFIGGEWRDTELSECVGNGFLLRSIVLSEVSFSKCALDSSIMKDVGLEGALKFMSCVARFSQIYAMRRSKDYLYANSECDFRNSLFVDYREEWLCNNDNLTAVPL